MIFEKGNDTKNIPPIHEQFSVAIFYYISMLQTLFLSCISRSSIKYAHMMVDTCVHRLCIFHMQKPESKSSFSFQLIYGRNVTKATKNSLSFFLTSPSQVIALYFIGFLPYYLNWIRE